VLGDGLVPFFLVKHNPLTVIESGHATNTSMSVFAPTRTQEMLTYLLNNFFGE